MSKNYRLEVITDQMKPEGFLPRIRVIMNYSETHYINSFAESAIADLGKNKDFISLMTKWCLENECGYRTSYDTFKFRNHEQLTLFILRWS